MPRGAIASFGVAAFLTLLLADPLVLGATARLRWVPSLSPGQLEAWLTVNPNDPVGHYVAGLRYRAAGRDEAARFSFERACWLDPSLVPPSAYLAEQLLNRGQSAAAYERVQKCLDQDPTFAPALVVLGRLHAERKEWQKARQTADAALASDGALPEAWLLKARACAEQGDVSGCRAAAERAVELRPALAPAWILVARSRAQQGDPEGALSAARRSVELQPGSSEGRARLGEALLACGAHAEAERALRQVKPGEPGGEDAALALAQVLLARGKTRDAVRQATRVVREWPLQNAARRVLAEGHAALGEAEAARFWWREYARWDRFLRERSRLERAQFGTSYDQSVHLRLARLSAGMGLWPEAFRQAGLGLQRVSQPASREFWRRMQAAYALRRDPAKADTALRRLDDPLRQLGLR